MNKGNSCSIFLATRNWCTSSAVRVPWSFCPLSISFSNWSIGLRVFANASATLRLRPPEHVVMRSATPHDSKKVSSSTEPKNVWPNLRISSRPRRIMAALVLLPYLIKVEVYCKLLSLCTLGPQQRNRRSGHENDISHPTLPAVSPNKLTLTHPRDLHRRRRRS